jgi:hypothetical protein
MTTIKCWLPKGLKQVVDQKVRADGYISDPEFVHDHVDRGDVSSHDAGSV